MKLGAYARALEIADLEHLDLNGPALPGLAGELPTGLGNLPRASAPARPRPAAGGTA